MASLDKIPCVSAWAGFFPVDGKSQTISTDRLTNFIDPDNKTGPFLWIGLNVAQPSSKFYIGMGSRFLFSVFRYWS